MDEHFERILNLLDLQEEYRAEKKCAAAYWDEKIKATASEIQTMRDNRNQMALPGMES